MRPYLLGVNNPQSADPTMALFPHDESATGHRLWSMVNEVQEISVAEWLTRTQRTNILNATELPRDYRSAARRRGVFLHGMIANRVVVMLGRDVADAMQHKPPEFVWGGPGGRWVAIPHPSGRNLFYNDPVNRLAVGILMWDILRVCGMAPNTPSADDLTELG